MITPPPPTADAAASSYTPTLGFASLVVGSDAGVTESIKSRKLRKPVTRNPAKYDLTTMEGLKSAVEQLQFSVRELQDAVIELQEAQFRARDIDTSGLPEHGARCEIMDGQFLRLYQSGAGSTLVTVKHGLGRVPQGAFFTSATAWHRVHIAGDITRNIHPANKEEVTFELLGSAGDTAICVLF